MNHQLTIKDNQYTINAYVLYRIVSCDSKQQFLLVVKDNYNKEFFVTLMTTAAILKFKVHTNLSMRRTTILTPHVT